MSKEYKMVATHTDARAVLRKLGRGHEIPLLPTQAVFIFTNDSVVNWTFTRDIDAYVMDQREEIKVEDFLKLDLDTLQGKRYMTRNEMLAFILYQDKDELGRRFVMRLKNDRGGEWDLPQYYSISDASRYEYAYIDRAGNMGQPQEFKLWD